MSPAVFLNLNFGVFVLRVCFRETKTNDVISRAQQANHKINNMESQVGHPQSNTDNLLSEDEVAKVKTGLPYESSFELHYPVLKQFFLKHDSSDIKISDSNLKSVNTRFPCFTKWFNTMKRDYTDYIHGFDTQLSKEC